MVLRACPAECWVVPVFGLDWTPVSVALEPDAFAGRELQCRHILSNASPCTSPGFVAPPLPCPTFFCPTELAQKAADLHNTLHAGGMGVDAPQPADLYFRLAIDRCFYVGQLSGGSAAEVLPGDAYRTAEADPLRTRAAQLTQQMNADRPEDIVRIRCVCVCVLLGRWWWWCGGGGVAGRGGTGRALPSRCRHEGHWGQPVRQLDRRASKPACSNQRL
jgi:hypothetical protein